MMSDLIRFGVSIDKNLAGKFDSFIKKRGYTNRSEAFRDLIRQALVDDAWQNDSLNAVGVISLVYDHEQRGLSHKITHLQHHYAQAIVSTVHVHLDEHNCFEVIVVKDKIKNLKEIADFLISTKGVKLGRLATAVAI